MNHPIKYLLNTYHVLRKIHAKHTKKIKVSRVLDKLDILDVLGHYEIISMEYKSLESHTKQTYLYLPRKY